MKVLFVFCEGPHDAFFLNRLLKASGQYEEYGARLKDYPTPLGAFIRNKFQSQSIDNVRIGKPNHPIVPICALKKEEDCLVFPISLGGMDKFADAQSLLDEIRNSFAADILERPEVDVSSISVLFVYDADDRGVQETVTQWSSRFSEYLPADADPSTALWNKGNGYQISIFVFVGDDGNKGTLEDNLVSLFQKENPALLEQAENLLGNFFEANSAGGNELAYQTKKKKGILTICGQSEKKSAGYALTMVVRDTKLLNGAFDFTDDDAQWTKLLKTIDEAFV